jgi:hypothetical protein
VDLNWKLRPGNFVPGTYLFPGNENLPQPPPTLDLLASYLAAANGISPSGALKFSGGGPLFRMLNAPGYGCSCKLSSLPNSLHGHEIQKTYGIHPVLCGAWLSISARIVSGPAGEGIVELVFRPQFALWNPLAEPIEAHSYAFEWRSDVDENRWNSGLSSKPALQLQIGNGNAMKVPIGDPAGGSMFTGTFTAAFAPGQVLFFSPATYYEFIVGNPCDGVFSTATDGCWIAPIAIDRRQTISIGRLVDPGPDKRSRWDGMALRLKDGETQSLLQEVEDFVDDLPTADELTPISDDGNLHPIFQMAATVRVGSGQSPRWLADYNPRASQVRRSARETFVNILVDRGTENFRTYPSWSVVHKDFSTEPMTPISQVLPQFFGGDESAVLFEVPRKFFSIGALQHVNLFPFSYHPAYAVGNSWAPPLLPRNSTWHSTASTYEYFTGEMLWDGSHLANCALYDNYFIGGFEDRGDGTLATYTHCEAVEPIGGGTPCDELARCLVNCGAINVNGASAHAWKIFLRSMPFDGASGTYYLPRHGKQTFGIAGCAGLCRLDSNDLDRLAEQIVAEVRGHGPFASLAEFVNRHPGDSSDPASRCGLLQRAIEKTGLRKFSRLDAANLHGSVSWFDGECASGDANTLCPADLSQADLLQFFGNSLTVRGDTFLIRAYGDSSDGSESNPIAAILEAIVQRTADDRWLIERIRWVR